MTSQLNRDESASEGDIPLITVLLGKPSDLSTVKQGVKRSSVQMFLLDYNCSYIRRRPRIGLQI